MAPPPKMHPVKRTLNILKHDVRSIWDPDQPPLLEFSSHVDLVIIGGGMMGSAIAYYIKQRTGRNSFTVMVIEKDPSVSVNGYPLSHFLRIHFKLVIFVLFYSTQDQAQW